jgi:methyl-accepting chemotaxis protein
MTSPVIHNPSDDRADSVTSQYRRILSVSAAMGVMLTLALLWIGNVLLSRHAAGEADAHLADAAERTALVLDEMMRERERQLLLLASTPDVVDAARAGAARANAEGLPGRPIEVNEKAYDERRSLDIDARVKAFLQEQLSLLGVAEILLTESHGFNAVTTQKTSDFVQSDEEWWKTAAARGSAIPSASYDESARQAVVSLAAAVRARSIDSLVGVIKVSFGLRDFDEALDRTGEASGIDVDLLDEGGRVIAGANSGTRLAALSGLDAGALATADEVLTYGEGAERQRAALRSVAGGRWRMIAHVPESQLAGEARNERLLLDLGVVALGALMLGALWLMSRVLSKRIVAPAERLVAAAGAVATGDLTRRAAADDGGDGQLDWATREMLGRLRHLAASMRQAAHETGAMSTEISASAEEMAASAQHVAETSNDLSQQSTEMAQMIQELASDSGRLATISSDLASGAQDGLRRNQQLRDLARGNRERLNAGAAALETLAVDVRTSAAAVDALVHASAQVRDFVGLVRKMARQSKLLALNAAMEAARAGEQGQGFAVVASEVRRLAAMSAESAEKTDALVAAVLERVEQSRTLSARNVETVGAALEATRAGLESFGQVERAVVETEGWTASIDRAASATNSLVAEMNARLDALSRHTESFAAAMEEVAATSEEQSASTEEISSSAAELGRSADKLSALVGTFKLDTAEYQVPVQRPPDERLTGVPRSALATT